MKTSPQMEPRGGGAAALLLLAAALPLSAALLLNGCQRRPVVTALPAIVQAPKVPPPPTPAPPDMKSPPPESISTAAPVKVTEAKPPRRTRRSTQKHPLVAPPVETAAVIAPPVSPVGELSVGAEATPKKQQDAAGLIASGERRLEMLAAPKSGPPPANEQQTQLKEIRHFLDGAKEALATGDAEGATTLATKARLLIDDLEKWTEK